MHEHLIKSIMLHIEDRYEQTVYSDRDWESGQSTRSQNTLTPPLGASNGIVVVVAVAVVVVVAVVVSI